MHVKVWKLQHEVVLARAGSIDELWEVLCAIASLAHTLGVGSRDSVWDHATERYVCVAAADTGDQPWDAELPAEALVEIKAAKGTVYEMGAKPWWCGP